MPDPFTCPFCGAVSHHATDAAERYCGRCNLFVDDEIERRSVGAQIRRYMADPERCMPSERQRLRDAGY